MLLKIREDGVDNENKKINFRIQVELKVKIKKSKVEDKNSEIQNKSNKIENKSENIEIKIDVNIKKVIEKEKFSRTEGWINTTFANLFYLDISTISACRIGT